MATSDPAVAALKLRGFDLRHSLEFFLEISKRTGCVLLQGEDDISSFDGEHLIRWAEQPFPQATSIKPQPSKKPPSRVAQPSAKDPRKAPQHAGRDPRPSSDTEGERLRKKPRTDAALGIPPDGDGWISLHTADVRRPEASNSLPPHASSPQPCPSQTPSTPPLTSSRPQTKRTEPQKPSHQAAHQQRRGRGGASHRAGKWYQLAKKDGDLARLMKLLYRSLTRSDVFQNALFSMISNASPASTGWQGFPMGKEQMDLLRTLYSKNEVRDIVKYFLPVYYTGKSTMLLDKEGRCFAFRTAQVPFLMRSEQEFYDATNKLMEAELTSESTVEKYAWGLRGDHFPCIIGHHRQYTKAPNLTEWHRKNMDRVDAFMKTNVITDATAYVSRTVEILFPGVAERMKSSADWQYDRYKFRPQFGIFYNLCVNGIFPHQTRIHCEPHLDYKNIVGVCALLVYQNPKTPFNPRQRSWVVLWEAGVAIELPPWVILIYPSSLLHHFNVDVFDFKFVTVDGEERPTPENSTPIVDTDGSGRGRGTFVYFNQATMYQSAETNCESLKEAARQKKVTTLSYPESIKAALEDYSYIYDIPAACPPS